MAKMMHINAYLREVQKKRTEQQENLTYDQLAAILDKPAITLNRSMISLNTKINGKLPYQFQSYQPIDSCRGHFGVGVVDACSFLSDNELTVTLYTKKAHNGGLILRLFNALIKENIMCMGLYEKNKITLHFSEQKDLFDVISLLSVYKLEEDLQSIPTWQPKIGVVGYEFGLSQVRYQEYFTEALKVYTNAYYKEEKRFTIYQFYAYLMSYQETPEIIHPNFNRKIYKSVLKMMAIMLENLRIEQSFQKAFKIEKP